MNYTHRYNAGRPHTLDSTQTEQLDRTIQQNRLAINAELILITSFNTSKRTIRRYHSYLGYSPRKSDI